MRVEVHARAVPPYEEWLVRPGLALDEIDGRVAGIVVDGLHALLGEWAGVLDLLLADLAEALVDGGVIGGGGAL